MICSPLFLSSIALLMIAMQLKSDREHKEELHQYKRYVNSLRHQIEHLKRQKQRLSD